MRKREKREERERARESERERKDEETRDAADGLRTLLRSPYAVSLCIGLFSERCRPSIAGEGR